MKAGVVGSVQVRIAAIGIETQIEKEVIVAVGGEIRCKKERWVIFFYVSSNKKLRLSMCWSFGARR
jgi:hypothetical protein